MSTTGIDDKAVEGGEAMCDHEEAQPVLVEADQSTESSQQDNAVSPDGVQGTLEAALGYHRRGWSIIPLGERSKIPVVEWKQYQDRPADEEQIRQWFGPDGENAHTNLAVVVGEATGRLACLDFDDEKAYERWAEAAPELARTLPTVETNRGRHVYFTLPADSTLRGTARADGIEVFVEAHIVVLPPSVHPSGKQYRWVVPLPDGDIREFDPVEAGLVPASPVHAGSRAEEAGSEADIGQHQASPAVMARVTQEALEWPGVPKGQRNDAAYRHAAFLLRDCGLGDFQAYAILAAWNSTNNPPLGREELLECFQNAAKHGQNAVIRGQADRDSILAPIGGGAARNEFKLPIPASQWAVGEEVDWVWGGFLAAKFITLLVGGWKLGKTTFIAWLSKFMESGGDLGGAIAQGRVLIVTEEPQVRWKERHEAIGLGDHVELVSRPFKTKPTPGEWEQFIEFLSKVNAEREYSVIVLDPWIEVSPVNDENDAVQASAALKPLHQLADQGTAVLILHHPRKGEATQGSTARGSGASNESDLLVVDDGGEGLVAEPASGPGDATTESGEVAVAFQEVGE